MDTFGKWGACPPWPPGSAATGRNTPQRSPNWPENVALLSDTLQPVVSAVRPNMLNVPKSTSLSKRPINVMFPLCLRRSDVGAVQKLHLVK